MKASGDQIAQAKRILPNEAKSIRIHLLKFNGTFIGDGDTAKWMFTNRMNRLSIVRLMSIVLRHLLFLTSPAIVFLRHYTAFCVGEVFEWYSTK